MGKVVDMTLEQALNRLKDLVPFIKISHGRHVYRAGFKPHYAWEVIAFHEDGDCYPPFEQKDDLLEALMALIDLHEWRNDPDTRGVYGGTGWRK